MTPAEQGQPRVELLNLEEMRSLAENRWVEMERLRADLEIAQRFCDEVVDELARQRTVADAYERGRDRERAARDEAVKREKALREALREIEYRATHAPSGPPVSWTRVQWAADVARAALDQSGKGARS